MTSKIPTPSDSVRFNILRVVLDSDEGNYSVMTSTTDVPELDHTGERRASFCTRSADTYLPT